MHATIIHHVMAHYLLKKGVHNFQNRGEEFAIKELLQLHTIESFNPKDPIIITKEGESEPSKYLMFLK